VAGALALPRGIIALRSTNSLQLIYKSTSGSHYTLIALTVCLKTQNITGDHLGENFRTRRQDGAGGDDDSVSNAGFKLT
jgi:hypothetical protein